MVIAQSASLGLISPAPRSAKRWARSAHLHEVKSATLPKRDWRDANRSRQQPASDDDVFGPGYRVESPFLIQANEGDESPRRRRGTPSRHSQRGRVPGQKIIAAAESQSSELGVTVTTRGGVRSEGDVSEGEGWVDTDPDGSGSEVGFGAG